MSKFVLWRVPAVRGPVFDTEEDAIREAARIIAEEEREYHNGIKNVVILEVKKQVRRQPPPVNIEGVEQVRIQGDE